MNNDVVPQHAENADNRRMVVGDNNIMRHAQRPLTQAEKDMVTNIKDKALDLHHAIRSLGNSMELSMAAAKVREAVFWATYHITR